MYALQSVVGKMTDRHDAVKMDRSNGNLSPRVSRMFKLTEIEGLKESMP